MAGRSLKPRANAFDMEVIAREHYPAVYRFCVRRVGYDRAPDATQETFLTAQRALGKYRGESSLSTWLLGIAHNECRRMCRKLRIEPLLLNEAIVEPTEGSNEQTLIDRSTLTSALLRLTLEHREVVVLHEIEGRTYEEIGEILGVPAGTVKSRLHHAFLNLRKHLNPSHAEVES